MKRAYDLIISLGGNCAAAHNLHFRNMRPFSLPFDWLYIDDDKPLKYLAEGFKNNFKDFCLKENLVHFDKISGNPEHSGKMKYKDVFTGYNFVNHFEKPIENKEEYNKVYDKLRKRIRRLFTVIDKSKKILIIVSSGKMEIDEKTIMPICKTLTEIYPLKHFDFELISFAASKDSYKQLPNCNIRTFVRKENLYDYTNTNFEWSFLDNIRLSGLFGGVRRDFPILFGKLLVFLSKTSTKMICLFIPTKKDRRNFRNKIYDFLNKYRY
jgi:hypothetical protein